MDEHPHPIISSGWINTFFYVDLVCDVPLLRCRRCDEWVCYLTMHARERHGDDIKVMAPVNPWSLSTLVW